MKFTSGGIDITTEVLPDGAQLLLGVRSVLSDGAILAQSTPHAMVEGWAETTLSLNTAEVAALVDTLPVQTRTAKVYLEVEVAGPGGAYRQTMAQQQVTLRCEVNMEDEDPPTVILSGLDTAPMKRGTKNLATGDFEAVAVAFPTSFVDVPRTVHVWLMKKAADALILAVLNHDSITADGFTVDLSSAVPVGAVLGDYRLGYLAIL